MSYTLSQTEKDQITAYKSAGEYAEAYTYIAGLLDTAVANQDVSAGTQNWFKFAAEINGNEPTAVNSWVRTYTSLAGLTHSIVITDADFNAASDGVGETVLDLLLDTGEVPATPENIIKADVAGGAEALGLSNEEFGGILFAPLFLDSTIIDDLILNDPLNADIWSQALALSKTGVLHLGAAALTPSDLVAAFVMDIVAKLYVAVNTASPLVFDLDDSGTIELKSLVNSTTYWDIDVDGFAEHSGWVTGGDGLLAVDLNEDGIINNNAELFGNMSGYANGFATLASYDSNHDGLITAADSVYSDLLMWVDAANDNEKFSERLIPRCRIAA